MKTVRLCIYLIALICLFTLAHSQSWTLRVCAHPDNLPASNQNQEGYDNHIAQLLADALGAELAYTWVANPSEAVRLYLLTGECDVMLGVADGAENLMNTVPYYRIPYVFVYRADHGIALQGLDDEALGTLTISTYPNSAPYRILAARGLLENLRVLDPLPQRGSPDYYTPMIQALDRETIDVAIMYGAEAAQRATEADTELEIVPIQPEIYPPAYQLFRIGTIAVRPGDAALRDQLNIALATKWDEIQAIFAAQNIPLQSVPRPLPPRALELETVRIGVVLPIPTNRPEMTDVIARAAQQGALFAEDLVGRQQDSTELALKVAISSAPTLEASLVAAQRLVQVDQVRAIVGGFSEAEARALGALAEANDILFMNIAAPSARLRSSQCQPHSFHIEASSSMYLDVLVNQIAAEAVTWSVIYEHGAEAQAIFEQAQAIITARGGQVRQALEVQAQQYVYTDELLALQDQPVDAVLIILAAADQELFLAQYQQFELTQPILVLPTPAAQSRDFFFRLQQAAAQTAKQRLVLWEAGFEGELSERFIGRFGEPFEPTAWAVYAAIRIIYQAVAATSSQNVAELIAYLESEQVFDLGKQGPLSFDSTAHQLLQPLYALNVNPDAPWSRSAVERLKIADFVAELSPSAEVWLGQGGAASVQECND